MMAKDRQEHGAVALTSRLMRAASRFFLDQSGNMLMITAATFPVLLLMLCGVVDYSHVSYEKKRLMAASRQACDRATKTRLTEFPTPESRELAGETAFDVAYKAKPGETNVVRNVSVVARQTTVSASTVIDLTFHAFLDVAKEFPINQSFECNSIPGYPHKDEVVYDEHFKHNLDGSPFLPTAAQWGYIDPTSVGWDLDNEYQINPSRQCGLEVQNWTKPYPFVTRYRQLPPEFTSPWVLELDGHCNTTISKVFEFHPGTYEFSLWYRGRFATSINSNQIGLYLVEADPVTLEAVEVLSDSNKRITMDDPNQSNWARYHFQLTVDEYSIYRLYLRGEGKNDGMGGLMSNFTITYLGME